MHMSNMHIKNIAIFLIIMCRYLNVIGAKPTPENVLPLIEGRRITSFFARPTIWILLLHSPLFRDDVSDRPKSFDACCR